jgi:hypothetical protein
MDWGDMPAWLALALSGGALWVSFKARGDGKKSANASATAAEASVRSAVAAEEALALQRQEAEARRVADEEAAQPRVLLRIERLSQQRFRMLNVGDAPAAGVTVLDPPRSSNGLSEPFELAPHSAHAFGMLGYAGSPIPHALRVTWDGQAEPVSLSYQRGDQRHLPSVSIRRHCPHGLFLSGGGADEFGQDVFHGDEPDDGVPVAGDGGEVVMTRSARKPNSSPKPAHSTAWMPIEPDGTPVGVAAGRSLGVLFPSCNAAARHQRAASVVLACGRPAAVRGPAHWLRRPVEPADRRRRPIGPWLGGVNKITERLRLGR